MKKKILAWTAAAVLVVLVSVCFFRPAPSAFSLSGGPYTWTEPVTLELSGPDADKFRVEYVGFFRSNTGSLYPDIIFNVRSLDGGFYSLGKTVWINGRQVTSVPPYKYQKNQDPRLYDPNAENMIGMVERRTAGGWEHVSYVDDNRLIFQITGEIFNSVLPAEADENDFYSTNDIYRTALDLPCREPGHYRVTLYARKLADKKDPTHGGSSEGDLLSFSFEYDVPEYTGAPLDILMVRLELSKTPYFEGDPNAILNAFLRANGDIRYIQPETFLFERYDTERESWVTVRPPTGRGSYWDLSEYSVHFDDTWPYAETVEHSFSRGSFSGGAFVDLWNDEYTYIPLPQVILRGWNETDQFRLSVDFAENPDGSGERCTVTIPLYFGE